MSFLYRLIVGIQVSSYLQALVALTFNRSRVTGLTWQSMWYNELSGEAMSGFRGPNWYRKCINLHTRAHAHAFLQSVRNITISYQNAKVNNAICTEI